MFAAAEAFQEIVVRLSVLRYTVTANTRRGKNDIATDAENFFAGLFNRLYGWKLLNLNVLHGINFPAIDLGDKTCRTAIQVTAENGFDKVRRTVDTFYDHGLEQDYDRLLILILSRKPDYVTDPATLTRGSLKIEAWDLDDLLGELERQVLLDELYALGDSLLKSVEEYTRRELPAVVRALSNGGKDEVGLMARLELVVGYPPATAQRFLDWYGFDDATEAEVALQDIVRLYEDLKNRSYVGGRHILKHAISNALTKREYEERFVGGLGYYLSDSQLIYYPKPLAAAMNWKVRETYWDELLGLQYSGWASPMENTDFLSIGLFMRSLDSNFFFELRRFLGNDIQKLGSVLVDLDFRHLD